MNWRMNINLWAQALDGYIQNPAHLEVHGPATPTALNNFEVEIGYLIPQSLRNFLANESCFINFWWHLKPKVKPLDVPDWPSDGYIEFNFDSMLILNADRMGWLQGDEDPTVKQFWKQAFVFLGVPNGDRIALDQLNNQGNPPVVYMNHEEPGKRIQLAESFEEFIETWFALGCVGNEIWELQHFLTDKGKPFVEYENGCATSKLDIGCKNALTFRNYFGL